MADTTQSKYVGLALSDTRQHRIPSSDHGVAVVAGKTHAVSPLDLLVPAVNSATIIAFDVKFAIYVTLVGVI